MRLTVLMLMLVLAAPLAAQQEGSGTSLLPDYSPMHAVHASAGGWELMLHGAAYLQYINQGSERGRDQLGSINWAMGMARRPLAGGQFTLRTMLSAEPWTIGGCGYPILLASGELCDGAPIVDQQHPHDLVMELSAEYRRPLGEGVALQLYLAPAGEPALGPVAFPHRSSAFDNPLAPISHHWFDATHIAFGVATAGIQGARWKVEGSLFNGREPDENRTDLDLGPLDSYAGRLWWLPSDRWALQLSAGELTEAEPGHHEEDPRVDVTRYTASATHHLPLGHDGTAVWATTLSLGRNVEEGAGTRAVMLESALGAVGGNRFFARAEWTEKAGHDLALDEGLAEEVFEVGQLSMGYVREVGRLGPLVPGIGVQGSVSFLPGGLEPYYGERTPLGVSVFAALRPAPMRMHATTTPPAPGAPPATDHGDHGGHPSAAR